MFFRRASLAFPALLLACVLAQSAAARQAAPTPEAPRQRGFITGRVVGEDGQPFAGARVFAQASRGRGDVGGAAVTGADGSFKIENLERAPYVVTANAPGYFDSAYLEYERGRRTFYRPGDNVSLTVMRGGVITGRVTDARGEPAVGVRVNMVRVRTADGRAVGEINRFMRSLETMTDDRGVYRNYGLLPGVYVVSAAGRFSTSVSDTAHSEEAPTFHPSTTRDAAAALTLRAGEELNDVDIRLRGERGFAVSGAVEGVAEATHAEHATILVLISASTTEYHGQVYIYGRATQNGFAFDSLTDGEYDLVAERYNTQGWLKVAASTRRVRVKGADVTGLKIGLEPLGSISGRLVFERPAPPPARPAPASAQTPAGAKPETAAAKPATANTKTAADSCVGSAEAMYADAAIVARREEAARVTAANEPSTLESSPDAKGDFSFRGIGAGAYRLEFKLGKGYFVTGVRRGAGAVAAAGVAGASKSAGEGPGASVRLRRGEDASGITVTAAYGAASLGGVVTFPACDCPEEPERVYLVPQERERADDALRYAEADIVRGGSTNGTYSFEGVAPGRYRLVVRPAPPPARREQPVFFDAEERARLRREAETRGVAVTLAPCQHAADVNLSYVPPRAGN